MQQEFLMLNKKVRTFLIKYYTFLHNVGEIGIIFLLKRLNYYFFGTPNSDVCASQNA